MARHRGSKKATGPGKPPLTHFLCLPLVNPSSRPLLDASLKAFANSLSDDQSTSLRNDKMNENANAVDRKAVRPYGTLHCTLGVMSLDTDGLERAKGLLTSLDLLSMLTSIPHSEEETGPAVFVKDKASPLLVELKGLTSMHPPHKTSVLYCSPSDSSGRLQPFCQSLQNEFKNNDLLVPDDRPLKLHATILNTIYVREKRHPPPQSSQPKKASSDPAIKFEESDEDGDDGDDRKADSKPGPQNTRSKGPLKIDARRILEEHQDFIWAESVLLDRVAICEMGAKKIMNSAGEVIGEEYTEVVSVPLPYLT